MLVNHTSELQSKLKIIKSHGHSIGLVPTMGALHSGHMSLMAEAAKVCEQLVVSIFVNPTQFNNATDLQKYPRNLAEDLAFIQKDFPEAIVFAPDVNEMYGNAVVAEEFDFGLLTQFMEGKYRAGHFNGVATIVKRLFDAVTPDYAFFGEKDYQQLRVIQELVSKTQQAVKIMGCPTQREANGLAKSSRNQHLSEAQKQEAGLIFKALETAKTSFHKKSIVEIKQEVAALFSAHPEFTLEYFEIADEEQLVPATIIEASKTYRAFIATFFNQVRLIDNLSLNS